MPSALDLMDRMITAIETGDLDGVRACYSPEIQVWTNFDDRARDHDAALRVLVWLIAQTSDRRYEVRRRVEIDGGVLQQHVLHGTVTATGKTFAMPACLVVTVGDGLVQAIDEYLDPAAMQPAFAE